KYAGAVGETWVRAEGDIRAVLDEMELPYDEAPGEAAFYGPKADFIVRDCLGRQWQLGTVQLDYVLPERFGLEYTRPGNQPHPARRGHIRPRPPGESGPFHGRLVRALAGGLPPGGGPRAGAGAADLRQGRGVRRPGPVRAAGGRPAGRARRPPREDRGQDPRR